MEQLNTVIFDIVIEFLLFFLLYSDTIKTSLYKFYTCAVIFFFSVVLLYVLPNIASPLIDFFLEMLLVFILLTDKWYNKIVSFVLVYILDSLLYQALALICDLILGFPIFVGMNTVKEKNIIKTIVILMLAIHLCITKISTFLILCDLAVCLATLYVSFSLVFALMRYLQGKVFLIRFYSPTTLSSSRAEFRLPSRLACA